MIREILQKSQEDLIKYTKEKLKENGYEYIFATDNYVMALGDIPIMLVAHLDTVHQEKPKTILYDEQQKLLWSPQGIGGDDRCGVYAILEIIKEYKPFVLFTTEEEVGGEGAYRFTEEVNVDLKKFINFIIEIDRRGNNQAVFYECGNMDFRKYILSFGFDLQWGTFSDISVISPAYDIASVNLSAGYYNEHTKTEYINMNELQNTIDKVKLILADKHSQYYNYQKVVYQYTTAYKDKFEDYNSIYNEDYEDCFTKNQIVQGSEEEYEDDVNFEDLLIEDYKGLSNSEFEEIYGRKKPKTIDELLLHINDYKI